MLREACCTICLSVSRRTINIHNTDLQYFYESLANHKVKHDVCWMCYICCARLQQCHRLQLLAIQTRGLVDEVCENKMEVKFQVFQSLLELTMTEINIASTSDLNSFSSKHNIKVEPEWTHHTNDDGIKCNQPVATTCDDSEDDQSLSKLDHKNIQRETKELKMVKEEPSTSIEKYGHPNPVTYSIKKSQPHIQYFMEVPILTTSTNKQSSRIKVEKEEEKEDRGIDRGEKPEDTTDYESLDLATEVETECSEKPHRCDVCFKTFSRRSYLNDHSKIHSDDRPYSCDVCMKTFSRKAYLNSHSKTHTELKPFSCNVCSKKFSWRSALQTHMLIHTGEKPFSCDICFKKFSQNGSLRHHIRTHTGEKPFACDFCTKKFAIKAHLKQHVRSHKGEKPYSCDLCPKRFSLKLSLKDHLRTHI